MAYYVQWGLAPSSCLRAAVHIDAFLVRNAARFVSLVRNVVRQNCVISYRIAVAAIGSIVEIICLQKITEYYFILRNKYRKQSISYFVINV